MNIGIIGYGNQSRKIINLILKQKRATKILKIKMINEILTKIKKKSIKNKVDPKITTRIWKSIIWGYVDYQKRNLKKK